jgi:hypothetical protein
VSGLSIRYNNDTGPTDEGFYEWWEVCIGDPYNGGRTLAKCDNQEDAERIVAALEAVDILRDYLHAYDGNRLVAAINLLPRLRALADPETTKPAAD